MSSEEIFLLIKKNEFKKLEEIFKTNNNIDLDIHDKNYNYINTRLVLLIRIVKYRTHNAESKCDYYLFFLTINIRKNYIYVSYCRGVLLIS